MKKEDKAKPKDVAFAEEIAKCRNILHSQDRVPGSRDERIWAAGFFDGEGTVQMRSTASGYDCSIDQSTIDLINLVRFCDAVGVGRIVPLKRRKNPNASAAARWFISSYDDLETVFLALKDFLNPGKRDGRPVQHKDVPNAPADGFARALAAQTRSALSRDKVPPGALVHEMKTTNKNNLDGKAH